MVDRFKPVVVAFLRKDTFVSSAVIQITPQQVLGSQVKSNPNIPIAERLNRMQQQILSRATLTRIIQKPSLDLYRSPP